MGVFSFFLYPFLYNRKKKQNQPYSFSLFLIVEINKYFLFSYSNQLDFVFHRCCFTDVDNGDRNCL
jgi:hypothetical protein